MLGYLGAAGHSEQSPAEPSQCDAKLYLTARPKLGSGLRKRLTRLAASILDEDDIEDVDDGDASVLSVVIGGKSCPRGVPRRGGQYNHQRTSRTTP